MMEDKIKVFLGAGMYLALIISLLLIGPVLLIWAINSLAEAGEASFYIEHNLWNYWVAFIILGLVRGGE